MSSNNEGGTSNDEERAKRARTENLGTRTETTATGEDEDVEMDDDATVVRTGAAPIFTTRCKMKLHFVRGKNPNAKAVSLLKEFMHQAKVVDKGMGIAPWYRTNMTARIQVLLVTVM